MKGFGLIGIIIVIAVIAGIAGGGLYWREMQNQKSLLQSGNDALKKAQDLKAKIEQRNQTAAGNPAVDTSNWKTYRDEKYGFEVKYPQGLVTEFFKNGTSSDLVTEFKIYDSKYIPSPGVVGAEVRSELREVDFTIFRFSTDRTNEIKGIVEDNISEAQRKNLPTSKTGIHSSVGTIPFYVLWSGLVGNYQYAYFYNKEYIFETYATYSDEELAKNILSTFQFIK